METFSGMQLGCGRHATKQTSSYERSGNGQKMDFKIGDELQAFMPFLGTALAGSVLHQLKTRWLGWRNFITSACSAGFGAWLVYQVAGTDILNTGLGVFATGMVGYSGGSLVDVFLATFTHKVEHMPVQVPQPKSGDEDQED